jgi:hypothetical protein
MILIMFLWAGGGVVEVFLLLVVSSKDFLPTPPFVKRLIATCSLQLFFYSPVRAVDFRPANSSRASIPFSRAMTSRCASYFPGVCKKCGVTMLVFAITQLCENRNHADLASVYSSSAMRPL